MICLPDLFRYWANFRPDDEAVVCEETRYTWRALIAAAEGVAAELQERGVQPGDRVAILLPNCAEWAVAYVGLSLAGAALVPLNPRFGSFELEAIAENADCAALVTTPAAGRSLAAHFALDGAETEDTLVIASPAARALPPTPFARAAASGALARQVATSPDQLAAIFYTSGSTGLPKGTMQTHATVAAFLMGYILSLKFTSDDRALIVAPLAFTGGCLSLLVPMLAIGACAIIEPAVDPERILHRIESERATFMTMVPAIWERLPEVPGWADADLSSLRVAMTGGAPVSRELLARFRAKGVRIRQVYGCTELGAMGCTPPEDLAMARPETVGFPQVTLEARVVHDGRDCAPGETGEIWVRGPQVMRGYWRDEAQTAAAFADGWFRTGDLVTRDEAGVITVVDRLKNMVISGGVNIYPAEIERALASLPMIAECGVFGAPDPRWGEKVVALVHGPEAIDPDALRATLRELLGPLKTPREIVVSPAPLPKTVTNKIARTELPALYATLSIPPAD
ncbi:long-chain fatty acid--CoA ligase [Sphingomonas sp. CL5.1]|uniref:class I adenylate-forming enzyme family protein n=1 Tax=Sphingomonas sp. CL5.1 TaxID=2653203 RepID=UPI00158337FA|nr:AMP-binding protein [Sphingomonas sp. CL5.1]QKR98382.1 long-chain fatty acid--CoA ligase [Sphingomonas sp. CL5.1]